MKRTIEDLDVSGKKVLLRLDFNVPMDLSRHIVTNKNRIMKSLRTINYLSEKKAKIIICSHLGRPKGKVVRNLSLAPVAEELKKLVRSKVTFAKDIVGKDAKEKIAKMNEGEIVVLENLRFDPREEKNTLSFCKELASLADIYVLDAFGTAHRKHASTYGVAKLLPSAIGFLVKEEIEVINNILSQPKRPLVVILGGAKIEDKIPVIENLLSRADSILLGGAMAFTFIKAVGGAVGKSLVDDSKIELARNLIKQAGDKHVNLVFPLDAVCNYDIKTTCRPKVFMASEIPAKYIGLDIGKKTIKMFKRYIKEAGTIIWNGPMGLFENPMYFKGTYKIAKYVAKSKAFSFVGGGDSVSAIMKSGYSKHINHLSTGGGASLMLLEGRTLPALEVIPERDESKKDSK